MVHSDDTHATTVNEHELRLETVKKLQEQGIDPWPAAPKVTATCQQVIAAFKPAQEKQYSVAGRLVTRRSHGKTVFAHIQDRSGRLQLYLKQDLVGDEQFAFFNHEISIGDIIFVQGTSFTTKTGEITLKVATFELLAKSLFPLPEKFHGLTDVEVRYRQRYLDLISNPESREKFKKRSAIVRQLRTYLDAHDFIEVETPMLHPIAGGAAARPFVTHHNAYDMDLYLRIAPELYLKRLVVGGFERVYEINRNFRNEGISTKHNPEFTMLEFYQAYSNYHEMMDFVEQLLRTVVEETNGTLQVTYGDKVIDFGKPFKRISMKEAVLQYGKLSAKDLSESAIASTVQRLGFEPHHTYGQNLVTLFDKLVEHHLQEPTFIIDFPIEISPLAKRDPNNPTVAARFELYIAGMEVANGFNELNDPFDQAERFKEQLEHKEKGDAEAHAFDADYIHALEYGLPPTVGCGIGIDRLVMLCTNTTSIKDVILFPTLKKKELPFDTNC